MRVPKRKSEEFRKYKDEGGSLHLTPQGLEKLKSQLVKAEKELPSFIAEVQRTGAFGDFSENAEYQAAKTLLRHAHNRIASLKDKIKRAVVITQARGSSGLVEIGSIVTVESGGKRMTFEILGSLETDPLHGRISYQSPIGTALVNRIVGETVTIETKQGPVVYRIVEVR